MATESRKTGVSELNVSPFAKYMLLQNAVERRHTVTSSSTHAMNLIKEKEIKKK